MERTYIIIDLEDITQEMIDECIQQSFEYLRRNLVGDKAILKWEGETPSSLIMLALPEYTNEEIEANVEALALAIRELPLEEYKEAMQSIWRGIER